MEEPPPLPGRLATLSLKTRVTKDQLVLWVAQGFGIGRAPFAPGTFGSLLGVAWFAILVTTGRLWLYGLGCLVGIICSVWFCGEAEKILGQTDPGSIVLDEISAMPLSFTAWLWVAAAGHGKLPGLPHFFTFPACLGTAAIFVAFRIFDVVKPWPIRRSQSLPGGWGVTIDDVLAAVGAGLSWVVFVEGWAWLRRG